MVCVVLMPILQHVCYFYVLIWIINTRWLCCMPSVLCDNKITVLYLIITVGFAKEVYCICWSQDNNYLLTWNKNIILLKNLSLSVLRCVVIDFNFSKYDEILRMQIKSIAHLKVFIAWLVIIVVQECNGERRECKEGDRTDWDQENRCFENRHTGIIRDSV